MIRLALIALAVTMPLASAAHGEVLFSNSFGHLRVIEDAKRGVVCYLHSRGGIDCLLISETKQPNVADLKARSERLQNEAKRQSGN